MLKKKYHILDKNFKIFMKLIGEIERGTQYRRPDLGVFEKIRKCSKCESWFIKWISQKSPLYIDDKNGTHFCKDCNIESQHLFQCCNCNKFEKIDNITKIESKKIC